MIGIPGLSRPLQAVGKHVRQWDEAQTRLWVQASSSVRSANCPACSRSSTRVHGCYRRQLDDSPCFGNTVTIALEIIRFKCVNRSCSQLTFSERLDPMAAPRQRRTRRLNEALRSLGYALGGAAGAAAARLAARLGMPTTTTPCGASCVAPDARRHPRPLWSSKSMTERSPAVTAMGRSLSTWRVAVPLMCSAAAMQRCNTVDSPKPVARERLVLAGISAAEGQPEGASSSTSAFVRRTDRMSCRASTQSGTRTDRTSRLEAVTRLRLFGVERNV